MIINTLCQLLSAHPHFCVEMPVCFLSEMMGAVVNTTAEGEGRGREMGGEKEEGEGE